MKRRYCEVTSFPPRGQSQSLPVTPSLVRINPLEHSVRARCHHCHEIVLQLLLLNVQIAALFARDSSGEPFHVLQCERGAGQSQSWSKKPLKDVGRGQRHYEILAHYSSLQETARKELCSQNLLKKSHLNYLFNKLSSDMKDCQDNEAVRFEFYQIQI